MKRISGHTVKSSQVVQSEQYFASAQTGYARIVIIKSSSNTTYAHPFGKRKHEPAESSMTEGTVVFAVFSQLPEVSSKSYNPFLPGPLSSLSFPWKRGWNSPAPTTKICWFQKTLTSKRWISPSKPLLKRCFLLVHPGRLTAGTWKWWFGRCFFPFQLGDLLVPC